MNSEQNKIVVTAPTDNVVPTGSKKDVELLPMGCRHQVLRTV